MPYSFSKIINPTAKAQYGNYVTNECYIVNENGLEIGKYFVTTQKDYFSFCGELLEMYSISHLPINEKKMFINEVNNKAVGYYQSYIKKEAAINDYGLIVLGSKIYNCGLVSKVKNMANQQLIIMNNEEQLFITYNENKIKIDENNVSVLQGTIEMQGSNLLLLFASIYYLEEMLFLGNSI